MPISFQLSISLIKANLHTLYDKFKALKNRELLHKPHTILFGTAGLMPFLLSVPM